MFLIPFNVSAYVKSIDYNGVRLNFFDGKINKTQCLMNFDSVDDKYLKGLYMIRVYNYNFCREYVHTLSGKYIWQYFGIIEICGCNIDLYKHELAHRCQYLLGDSLPEGKLHKGNFEVCLNEI